ncbi:alpha/beta hydrolase [Novilysobacter spongiicola]|uniref:Serine aminopeptidase S33 domain-containing protein n=1 Tax=Lysobacter spongiicola DSM 21749 TaxID=1122188 RepID=A0A1T4N873_9GAMM|nr:alpha/beta fold hydrolase [Lysobacter spongiicola]SJZ75480.1 hypothetical protein SAMN02745674_00774 [Lysobacter spongiicola DSM 21749]
MHRSISTLALATLLAGAATALAQTPNPPAPVAAVASSAAEETATRLLDQLDASDYRGAASGFSAEMAAALPVDQLKAVWESLPAQFGAATGRGESTIVEHGGMQVVLVPLHHERGELLAQVAVDAEGKVAGFMIKPAPPPAAAPPPEDAGFSESDFSIGEGDDALPGTLAMPAGEGPFPGLVLVHGSGPHDRDETVGANRPFLDIARGLASQGIAVLRYDKRTSARPQDFADGDFTIDEETTDDAVAAVAALRGADRVDPDRVFVLGHSQGGMLAPRIAARSGEVAGLVMLAAPARPLLDLLPEQNRYLLSADGSINAAEQDFLETLDEQIARVRSGEPMEAKDTPMGLPPGYWRQFDAIDPVADAVQTELPMLLLQGGRDFQVVDADWQLWQRALGDRDDVTLRHYPSLNHLGIAGDGPGSLEEYQTPGHVDERLIGDIARWIKR